MNTLKDLVKHGYSVRPADKWPTYDGCELDRSKFITSSEIGSCARSIKYSKQGNRAKLERYGFAERGHTAERWVVEQLRHAGAKVSYEGENQVSFHHGVRSGTPDGIVEFSNGDVALFDIKCVDPRANWNALPRSYNVDQVLQNIDLVEACLDRLIDYGILFYINATDYEDIKEIRVDIDEDKIVALRIRAEEIAAYETPEDAPPEGVFNGSCRMCDFRSMCSGAVKADKLMKAKEEKITEVGRNVFGK